MDNRYSFGHSAFQAAIGRVQDFLILPAFLARNRELSLTSIAAENASTWRAYASAFDAVSLSTTFPARRNSSSTARSTLNASSARRVPVSPTISNGVRYFGAGRDKNRRQSPPHKFQQQECSCFYVSRSVVRDPNSRYTNNFVSQVVAQCVNAVHAHICDGAASNFGVIYPAARMSSSGKREF